MLARIVKRVAPLRLPARSLHTTRSAKKSNLAGLTFGLLLSASAITFTSTIYNDSKRRIIVIEDNDESNDEDLDAEELEERKEQQRLERLKNKPALSQIFNISDFEYVAKQILPEGVWGYYSTGSDDEFSIRENHYAFGRIFFRPKCLVDVKNVTLKTKDILGIEFDAPFYCTAFAGSPMAHIDAEKNLIRACGNEGVPYLVPIQLSFPLDEFMKEKKPGQKSFHQIHFYNEEQLKKAPEYFKYIEETHPDIKAIFVNVDLPCIGNREKDAKIRASLDASVGQDLDVFASSDITYQNLTWDDMKKIRASTNIPIVLKGVLRKEDVLKAAEIGLNGCLLSNHGGRQLDFAMPPIEILAQSNKLLKENNVDRTNFHIFIDGGIRRGSDIIKALCLGASAVGMGRPFLYSMATYGQDGVEKAMKILKDEMVRDMKLLGVSNISELNEDLVDIESLKYKGISTNDRLYDYNYSSIPPPPFRK
ncbi:hypothetical protein DAMA08_022720 [Martiniozyma asiatica (nom. inval.)]|nr:hypothetical protein DAMA08_022720 [Martiniozyma asiatica]